MPRRTRSKARRSYSWLWIAGLILLIGLPACACAVLPKAVSSWRARNEPVVLEVACSPEKEQLFTALVRDFQGTRPRLRGGRPVQVRASRLEPDLMIEAALEGRYQAISPDSSIWLTQLDLARQEGEGGEVTSLGQAASMVGEVTRYAVSPVVIAMWEEVARSMGYPERELGWGDLLARAQSDPDFKWSHPSTSSASGLLATLAEFYAGAGKTRGLTREDALAQSTLDYVGTLEKTVRHYGEGELALVQQMLRSGPAYLDAVVVQEQLVIDFNRQGQGRLVAIYPVEGSLWEDHPLALLEQPGLSAEQRLAYAAFRDYLLSPAAQRRILEAGYRPVDLSIPLTGPDSPIRLENGVDPLQPKTALQIPGAGVLEVVRDVWWYTKRHANIYLVADTSGSMEGDKLADAQEALRVFLAEIRGDAERVGLIRFSSSVHEEVPLGELANTRQRLRERIDGFYAGGNTALLDAVSLAYAKLHTLNDRERINAIVVMTDGQENNSRIGLGQLLDQIEVGNKQGPPVVIFCIAYGKDADMGTLQRIADAAGGQARQGDLDTIRRLYQMLSAYF
ncbi:MAG: VWA domain-containing protein [Anaerolineae bacterium]|nr:VWA domain-containing protein [Anaerolineae bacterium]